MGYCCICDLIRNSSDVPVAGDVPVVAADVPVAPEMPHPPTVAADMPPEGSVIEEIQFFWNEAERVASLFDSQYAIKLNGIM
nr:salivary glue protein Sgs-3-like [Ipomoea trifida]